MADITMCHGNDCPLKNKCYRYTAYADQYWQSIFTEIHYNDGKCKHFCYGKGYAQGKIDFAKELTERIGCIEACDDDEYNMGADWAINEVSRIIDEMVGDSDGRG